MGNLPVVGGSYNTWGVELNNWLLDDHLSEGRHHSRVMSTGVSFDTSVTNGDVVYFDYGFSGFKQALADGTYKQNAVGIRKDTTAVVLFGAGDSTAVLIPGTQYYLSDTTAGRITSVVPGNVVKVGIGITPTMLLVNIR